MTLVKVNTLICISVLMFGLTLANVNLPWGPYVVSSRSGRSSPALEWRTISDTCCPLGLRTQLSLDDTGHVYKESHCGDSLPCCDGLLEQSNFDLDYTHVYTFCLDSTMENRDIINERSDKSTLSRILGIKQSRMGNIKDSARRDMQLRTFKHYMNRDKHSNYGYYDTRINYNMGDTDVEALNSQDIPVVIDSELYGTFNDANGYNGYNYD